MLTIPSALKTEHEELHEHLRHAIKTGGRTGEAARAVAAVLHPHFVREEKIAMPPLGLLGPLAMGEADKDMEQALTLTDTLEAELPKMLAEHREITGALDRLVEAAQAEGKSDVARFAEKLKVHALTEEQVLYPAALLVGRYIKAIRGKASGRTK